MLLLPAPTAGRFVSSHNSAETEHGHIHGYQDHGDQETHEHDQGGFEERSHAFNPEFEFFGERFALSAEHLGQAVGFFADADKGREFAVVQGGEPRHAGREEFAVFQSAADRSEGLPVGIERDYVGEHAHAREQRNPGHAEQVKQAAELRLVVFADNRACDGQAKQKFRNPSLYRLSVSVGV